MEFRVLGPLEVLERDTAVPVVGLKQRTLLAVLLLHANETVAGDFLIGALWRERPPETAHNTLQAHISRLRRTVGRARIESQAPGYLLHLDPSELDVNSFERLAGEGRHALAHGDPFAAGLKLREALALWRGSPLADFTSDGFAQAEILRLQEIRLAATEDRIEADLAAGLHADLVGELEALVADHPYRERLRGQLMLALYRCGRQAEALEVYRATRRVLVEQLGIEPSPALHRLETAILLQDPALELPERRPTTSRETSTPESVQKPVTVVAVDSMRAAAAERVREILVTHEATVEAGAAGQVIGLFGSPVVREDDAARAARAALRLRQAEPRLRIAVESGKVVESAGMPLADALLEVARALAKEAGPGEVVIGPVARSLLPPGAHVKPRTGAQQGFLLSQLAARRTRGRPLTAPLIGRRVELGQLLQTFESTRTRRTSHLATVLGAPGIGKSRLAEELEARLREEASVLVGRCPPYGEGTAFSPLAEIVRRVSGDATPGGLIPLLESDEQARLVASRLAGAFGSGGAPGEAEDTLWAFRRLLEALARTRPTVVVFEDVHWADETLLDFVEHVAEWSRGVPLLLLCLARPELLDTRPAWSGGKLNAVTVSLEPLSEGESSELMELLAHSELPEDRRQRIREVAEGNPLFIEQMLALARDQGSEADLTIPPTIEAILAARLDRLEPAERRVLERAAVVGREFWLPAVEELSLRSERSGVLAALRRLVRKDLVLPERTRIAGEESFRFRHLLIRDVAYDFVPKPLRADLHERLGNWLEEAEVDLGEDLDAVIGFQLEQAYLIRRDSGVLTPSDETLAMRAAERLAATALREVGHAGLSARVELLQRAVALVPPEADKRGLWLVAIGSDLQEMGDRQAAVAAFGEAERLALVRSDEPLRLYVQARRLAYRVRFTGDLPLETLIHNASSLLNRMTYLGADYYAMATRAMLASAHLSLGQAQEATRLLAQVIHYGESTNDTRLLSMGRRILVGAWLWGPTPARDAIARCRRILDEDPPLRVAASVFGALSVLLAMNGRFDAGRRYARRDKEALTELGLLPTAAGISCFEATVELLAGDAVAAEQVLRSALEDLIRLGDVFYRPAIATLLAHSMLLQARDEEAFQLLENVSVEEPGDISVSIRVFGLRARILANRGHSSEALESAKQGVDTAMNTDHLVDQANAVMDLAYVYRVRSQRTRASRATRRALALYQAKGHLVGARAAGKGAGDN